MDPKPPFSNNAKKEDPASMRSPTAHVLSLPAACILSPLAASWSCTHPGCWLRTGARSHTPPLLTKEDLSPSYGNRVAGRGTCARWSAAAMIPPSAIKELLQRNCAAWRTTAMGNLWRHREATCHCLPTVDPSPLLPTPTPTGLYSTTVEAVLLPSVDATSHGAVIYVVASRGR